MDRPTKIKVKAKHRAPGTPKALRELFSPLGHQIDIKYKDMSSLEKPVGLSSLVGVGGKTERTTRALQARFLELVEKVRQTRPASDIELLRRAFDFAAEQHRTQLRKSGDPYLSHPLEVAHILADMKLDITTLCAALLHDVVELSLIHI